MGWATVWATFSQAHLVTLTVGYAERLLGGVARFFLVQNTKTGKIYQITTNCTKCP
jgi:hypothetical protein